MKDWKGLALSLAIGIIMAGGLSAAVASVKLAAVRTELREEIKEVELDGDVMLRAIGELSVSMARLEAQMKAANDKLDALAR